MDPLIFRLTYKEILNYDVIPNAELERILTESGWYSPGGSYTATVSDHQGNLRSTLTKTYSTTSLGGGRKIGGTIGGDIIVEPQKPKVRYANLTAYSPYGLPLADWQGDERYLYSGKELDRTGGLMLYDFHARQYDPQLGRFTTQDPLQGKYPSLNSYLYCAANPISLTDPTVCKIFLRGETAASNKTLAALNANVRYQFKKSTDGSLYIDFSGMKNFPMNKIESELFFATSDVKNHLNINSTSDYLFHDESSDQNVLLIVGNFAGSEVDEKTNTTVATQHVNPYQAETSDKGLGSEEGVSVVHEVLECYYGATDNPGVSGATSSNESEAYNSYISAHERAKNTDPRFKEVDTRSEMKGNYFNLYLIDKKGSGSQAEIIHNGDINRLSKK